MVLLFLIGFLAQVSPLVLFFVFFKRINKIVELRVIFLYVLTSLISIFLLGAFKNHSSLIISIFAMVEFSFFSAFFYLVIISKKIKALIIMISGLALCAEIVLLYFDKENFDFWVALITAVLIVAYSISYFYEQLNSPETLIIYQSYTFWIVVGCIIYLSGTLFLFLYTSDLKNKQSSSLWAINISFEIVKNVFFSIAFIIARKIKQRQEEHTFVDSF